MLRICQQILKYSNKLPVHNIKRNYSVLNICGDVLFPSKILSVVARPSIFYLRFPYVLKICYNEPYNYSMVLACPQPVIFNCQDNFTQLNYKYKSKHSIKQDLKKISLQVPSNIFFDNII